MPIFVELNLLKRDKREMILYFLLHLYLGPLRALVYSAIVKNITIVEDCKFVNLYIIEESFFPFSG